MNCLPVPRSSPPVFNRVRVVQSLVFCVVFCRLLLVLLLLLFFLWPLCCLSFDLRRRLNTPLDSSYFSHQGRRAGGCLQSYAFAPTTISYKKLKKGWMFSMEAKNYQRNKREEFFGAKWPFFFIACLMKALLPTFPSSPEACHPLASSLTILTPPTPKLFNTLPKLAPHFEVPSESLLPSHFPNHFYASAHGYTVFEVEQFNKRIYLWFWVHIQRSNLQPS